jgi:hypothetical protein
MPTVIRFEFQDRNQRENLTVTINIQSDTGASTVSGGSMTHSAYGKYYYDYSATSTGWYHAQMAVGNISVVQSKYAAVTSAAVVSTTSTDIANTQELAQFMNIEGMVPSRDSPGANRTSETVGTGDGSTTAFYLNNAYVIAGTYSFGYGSAVGSQTALTETTHYTLDKDLGKLTLTSAGVTAVSTNNIYGEYSYCLVGLTDTQFQAAIDRAQAEVEKRCYSRWADGSTTTPNYAQITNEKHTGKGRYDRAYYLNNYPLPDVSTQVATAMGTADTSMTVDSTQGFLSTGRLGIEGEAVSYTGKTATTFTGLTRGIGGGTASPHVVDTYVYPFIFELSTTESGSTPTWQMLQPDTEYDLDLDAGRLHLYRDDIVLDVLTQSSPPTHVPNRIRATYIWGESTIPADIKRVILMVAAKDIMHMAVRRAHANGFQDFRPENIMIDENWIQRTIESYTNYKNSNV